jgi:polyhydroxyalkanoate synthesis regulator phasin
MAENEEKRPPGRAEAVRNAAVQAFEATAGQAGISRERAQDLANELAQAAARVRGAIDELRPATADEVRALRDELRALERRVAVLEAAAPPPPAQSPKTPATPRKRAPRAST